MLILLIVLTVICALVLFLLLFRNPDANLIRFERSLRDEVSKNREEMSQTLMGFTRMNEQKLDIMRKTVEERLKDLQADNAQKLEKMRQTVDEKLHDTLERRLGDSFKLVSDRLERVQMGLGEMQKLATGVGDLKKVLTNVKTRGILGEIQLETLLDEVLTRDQYARNVVTKQGSRDNVEFAIRLPGKGEDAVWLPVDAKFPKEDYERLLEAQEQADPERVEHFSKILEAKLKFEAKDIRAKYIDPPRTTDFAILFLATEGLYAEAIRRPGLFDLLQREYRVVLTGPTTIVAFLSSLQMGFRTLVIERRASEVWNLLGAVKSEFSKFGDLLDKTNQQLETVTRSIKRARGKTRTIDRKLREVQELPVDGAPGLLTGAEDADFAVEEESAQQ